VKPSLGLGIVNGGEFHALLLLSLITEPDSNDTLFQVELLGHLGDLLARRPRLHAEIGLEGLLLRRRDRRPLALPVAVSFPLRVHATTRTARRTATTSTTTTAAAAAAAITAPVQQVTVAHRRLVMTTMHVK
jgi:hypothetical protein